MGEGKLQFNPWKNCQRLKRGGEKFILNVTIPPNTTATVFVPAKSVDAVTESGGAAGSFKNNCVKFLREENGRVVYEIESGECKFESQF